MRIAQFSLRALLLACAFGDGMFLALQVPQRIDQLTLLLWMSWIGRFNKNIDEIRYQILRLLIAMATN